MTLLSEAESFISMAEEVPVPAVSVMWLDEMILASELLLRKTLE